MRMNKSLLFWLCHISGWAALFGVRLVLYYRESWGKTGSLFAYLFPYISGFILCLLLRFVFRRFKRGGYDWKVALIISLFVSFIGANIWLGVDLLSAIIRQGAEGVFTNFTTLYLSQMMDRGMTLLGWSFLYFGISAYIEFRDQESQWARASSLAQSAQLQMLRYQINPHFLFNAMNSIRALIDEDEAKAQEMITELSEFLRYSLSSKEFSNVPLRHEIEALTHYFAIQKKRYEDKLQVDIDIDPAACEFPVLSFLIHPLVENAIKYGMRTSPMPLHIRLTARVEGKKLILSVCNTGQWITSDPESPPHTAGTGTGLDNVRQRLDNAFPRAHRLDIIEKEGGVHVELEIDRSALNETTHEKTI